MALHAAAAQHDIDNGIEITVTGEGRTLGAIKQMVPARDWLERKERRVAKRHQAHSNRKRSAATDQA
jgi:hypothetical protein